MFTTDSTLTTPTQRGDFTERASIEVRTQQADDSWRRQTFGPEGEVELSSIGVRISITAIYEDVEMSME